MSMSKSSGFSNEWALENLEELDRIFANPLQTNKYLEHIELYPIQKAFLIAEAQPGIDETLYGGGSGPGKTFGLEYWLFQYAHLPGYRGGGFRHTIGELYGPTGLIPVAKEMLAPSLAAKTVVFNENRREFTFDSGAKVVFGGLYRDEDIKKIDGWSFQRAFVDEITAFVKNDAWLKLLVRLRRLKGFPVAPSLAGGTNPDGPGRVWVGERFGLIDDPKEPQEEGTFYVHTDYRDSPDLDHEDYERKFAKLGSTMQRQKQFGDWNVTERGELWGSENFPYYELPPNEHVEKMGGGRVLITVDCKNKLETSENPRKGESFVSMQLFLATDGYLDLLDEEHGAYGFNDTVHAYYRLRRRWPGCLIATHIENKAMGPALIKQLKKGGELVEVLDSGELRQTKYPAVPGVRPHPAKGDKLVRIASIQTFVLAGNIRTATPKNARHVKPWRAEVAKAPKAPNDRPDALVIAVEVAFGESKSADFKSPKPPPIMRKVVGW